MYPDGALDENYKSENWSTESYSEWIKLSDIDKLDVSFIGLARNTQKGVVLSSYNAG